MKGVEIWQLARTAVAVILTEEGIIAYDDYIHRRCLAGDLSVAERLRLHEVLVGAGKEQWISFSSVQQLLSIFRGVENPFHSVVVETLPSTEVEILHSLRGD
jgi:hypothetical protein